MNEVIRVKCGMDNCYLVKSGENAILVDTCRTAAYERVLAAAREHVIRAVVLTHGHFDHCQNAAGIARELNVPIALGAGDIDLAKDNTLQRMYSSTCLGKVLQVKASGEFKRERIAPFEVDVALSDGDTLEMFGIEANVIGLPGHTWGSVGFDLGEAGLIVGDALYNVPNARKAMIYADRDAMEASASKIGRMGEKTLWYGHGDPTGNWLFR